MRMLPEKCTHIHTATGTNTNKDGAIPNGVESFAGE